MVGAPRLPPIEFASLERQTKTSGFTCVSREINTWFRGKAHRYHRDGSVRVTCAVESGKPARPYGFYALATVSEEVSILPGAYHRFRSAEHFSALQLVWLATDQAFERQGLGTRMVGRVIRTFAEIGPQVGLPHLIVIPDPADHERLTRFYGKLGFTPYRDGEAMFLDLQSAVEAVRVSSPKTASAAVAVPIAEADEPQGEAQDTFQQEGDH